ncbi:hypothetical protein AgCh_034499 [Apium graveolens]
MNTALQLAVTNGHLANAKLLVESDPSNTHVRNGKVVIVKMICTTCRAPFLYGLQATTALHAAIIKLPQDKKNDRDVVKVLIDAAKRSSCSEDAPYNSFEALFNRTDVDLAMRRDHLDMIELILVEDPAYQHGHASKNINLKPLIYVATEHGYKDMVKLTHECGNTLGHGGQTALKAAFIARDEESIFGILGDDQHLVTYADSSRGWTPLHYAAYYAFDSALDVIVQAQTDVGYQFVSREKRTPLYIAAENGHISTVIRLMQLWPLLCVDVDHECRDILYFAVIAGNKDMILCIMMTHCPEKHIDKILNEKDINDNTPLHLVIGEGCFAPELIKHKKVDNSYCTHNNITFTVGFTMTGGYHQSGEANQGVEQARGYPHSDLVIMI